MTAAETADQGTPAAARSMTAAETLAGLPSLTLAEVVDAASLQTRVDRKYLLTPADLDRLLDVLADRTAVLEIDGLRAFRYESVYFDTPRLDSYLGSAHGRRRRFKVRTRTYLDSGECVLEVKAPGGRGETVKERLPHPVGARDRLTVEADAFLRDHGVPADAITVLRPTLTTSYRRTTLVDPAEGVRITCDTDLVCRGPRGRAARLPGTALVEVKGPGRPTVADRALWAAGHRPVRVSKYCTGLAALTPGLPAHRWNRTLRRHFGWEPAA